MADLVLNQKPIEVPYGGYVKSAVATEGYNVVTITPSGNFEAKYRVDYGGSNVGGTAPEGSPIPYPWCQKWANSSIKVNNLNTQEDQSFWAGLYGFNQNPTKPLENVDIGQYESAGKQTSSGNMTLTLTNRSANSVLLIYIVGSNAPQCIALNTDPDNLPPQYQNLGDFFKAVKENTFQVSKNWYGQYMYVINLSLTAGDNVNVRLQ